MRAVLYGHNTQLAQKCFILFFFGHAAFRDRNSRFVAEISMIHTLSDTWCVTNRDRAVMLLRLRSDNRAYFLLLNSWCVNSNHQTILVHLHHRTFLIHLHRFLHHRSTFQFHLHRIVRGTDYIQHLLQKTSQKSFAKTAAHPTCRQGRLKKLVDA